MSDETNSKIVALFGLFFGTVFFGIVPIKVEQILLTWRGSGDRDEIVRRTRWGDTILSWLLCFGGGVLFATCFIHMIPEVREGFIDAKLDEAFPWTELIISCGFFLIYLVEELVHWALCLHAGHAHHASETRTIRSCAANPYEPRHNSGGGARTAHHHSHNHVHRPGDPVVPKFSLEKSVEMAKNKSRNWSQHQQRKKDGSLATAGSAVTTTGRAASWDFDQGTDGGSESSTAELSRSLKSDRRMRNYGSVPDVSFTSADASTVSARRASPSPPPNAAPQFPSLGLPGSLPLAGQQLADGDQHQQQRSWSLVHAHSISPIRSVFIILALSFHSIFEGLAIGLQRTATDVWYLFAAVALHKFVITFCVGLELVVGGVSRTMIFLYILVFAFVSPVGVGAGIGLSELGTSTSLSTSLVSTVLSGIAAGTLLYVTFFEVLAREREREAGNGVVRVAAVILGYGAMVAMELANGHEHG